VVAESRIVRICVSKRMDFVDSKIRIGSASVANDFEIGSERWVYLISAFI